ncbi:hypothetical protein BCY91_05025 [Pelobium manganitolerans]|uniref:Uncharacterized protein n=2 Tax=Pelobium manganitolerans TaxID=1842495 RepID=A0A419S620_9SPHI|nr:hypothetical protein BCY91_05025 [Pelobium manganitolerans]
MNPMSIKKTLLSLILISLFPIAGWANTVSIEAMNLPDTISVQKQDKKKETNKGKTQKKQQPNNPTVKKVPKARKQPRPQVIVKPKIKPIKVIKPKIKKP